jgi:DNA polymerase III delta prime subunit
MFSPLPREIQFNRIRYILDKEGIVSNLDSIIYLVIDISEGDLRKSINQIQSISSIVSIKSDISIEELNDFLGIINQSEVDKIMNSLMEVSKPMNNLDLINLGIDFLYEGYDLVQLIKSINETIIKLYDNIQIQYGEKCIKELLGVLMDSEVNCLEGSDPEMEIKYLFANLNSLFKANKKKISSRIDID